MFALPLRIYPNHITSNNGFVNRTEGGSKKNWASSRAIAGEKRTKNAIGGDGKARVSGDRRSQKGKKAIKRANLPNYLYYTKHGQIAERTQARKVKRKD
ncbi:MAG: hypothetical protein EBE86_028825 [Hormoscilla sp. GUM202]|nr:hypothetical protein [Hormoscilla sp. GUM202]